MFNVIFCQLKLATQLWLIFSSGRETFPRGDRPTDISQSRKFPHRQIFTSPPRSDRIFREKEEGWDGRKQVANLPTVGEGEERLRDARACSCATRCGTLRSGVKSSCA